LPLALDQAAALCRLKLGAGRWPVVCPGRLAESWLRFVSGWTCRSGDVWQFWKRYKVCTARWISGTAEVPVISLRWGSRWVARARRRAAWPAIR